MIAAFIAFFYNLYLTIKGTGHPVQCIISAIIILMGVVVFALKYKGRLELFMYLTVPYLLVNTIGTVCVYKDWLPASLIRPNKDVFDF